MLRPLLYYFLAGGLLFTVKTVSERQRVEGPEVTVRVSSQATPAEVEQSVSEAILLNEARRYGWDRRDPVVYTHLVRNMRFIEPDSTDDDATLFRRALHMNMHGHDPIVRARLLYRAREALGYVPEDRMPTRSALQEHLEAHADRFQRESKIRCQHVFLSRSKRGSSLPADARAMRQKLTELGEAPPTGLGDPLPGLRSEQLLTPSKARNEYGAEVAELLREAIVGVWRGPAASVYGLHFIKVLDRAPPYVPSLDVIGAEVRADLLREIRKDLKEERMAALRDAYTVTIERVP